MPVCFIRRPLGLRTKLLSCFWACEEDGGRTPTAAIGPERYSSSQKEWTAIILRTLVWSYSRLELSMSITKMTDTRSRASVLRCKGERSLVLQKCDKHTLWIRNAYFIMDRCLFRYVSPWAPLIFPWDEKHFPSMYSSKCGAVVAGISFARTTHRQFRILLGHLSFD